MRMSRRGAEFKASTPIVVLLIGLVLILYILFLPPAQREALLSGSPGTGVPVGPVGPGYPGGPVAGGGVVIMDKFVGTLNAPTGATREHGLPSTTVFTAVNTEEVKFLDSLFVQRGAFSSQVGQFTFRADPVASKNYLLTFNVEEAHGSLRVFLNGNLLFEREIVSKSPEPIKLPQEHLQPENTITFEVGGTGWQFWNANRYDLRNILVSADVTRYEASSSEQHFTITPDEHQQLEQAVLEFVPQCDPRQAGRLTVTINGALLYAGFIDCGVISRLDIAKEQLNIGDNRLGFSAAQGGYTIDRLKVISMLAEEEPITLYFNLPPDMWQQANAFAGRVVVTIRFSDMQSVKRGSIMINGYRDTFQTNADYFQATLDPNILTPGPNSIQLIPEGGSLNVPQLRVELLA